MPLNMLTNILLIVVLCMSAGWIYTYIDLKEKYTSEQIAYADFREQTLLSDIEAQEISAKATQDLQNQHNIQVKSLENEIKVITSQSLINQSELNSLYKTLNKNQDSVTTATPSAVINYTKTLSNLLGECSTMVTEVSTRADEATTVAISYHQMLTTQKQIVDEYNQKLDENKTNK